MEGIYIGNAKNEIQAWAKEGPGWLAKIGDWVLWPATKAAEALIPAGVQEAVAKSIEGALLGISTLAESSFDAQDVRSRFKEELAREGNESDANQELAAADRVAQHYWNWNLSYAAAEGGATGAAGLFGLAADIPALFTIVMRLIQQISISYGFDPNLPEEREYVIHVLRVGSAGDLKGKLEALIALKELEQILIKVSWKKMSQDLAAKQIGKTSLLAAVRQLAKSLGINLTKRKALQLVPVIGALVGASFNATYANDIGRSAYMKYRERWLLQRKLIPSEK